MAEVVVTGATGSAATWIGEVGTGFGAEAGTGVAGAEAKAVTVETAGATAGIAATGAAAGAAAGMGEGAGVGVWKGEVAATGGGVDGTAKGKLATVAARTGAGLLSGRADSRSPPRPGEPDLDCSSAASLAMASAVRKKPAVYTAITAADPMSMRLRFDRLAA